MTDSSRTIRIVVGVDFSEVGDHALDEAIRYAHLLADDELHPVYVLPGEGPVEELADRMAEAKKRLRTHVVERCEALGEPWEQRVVFHVRLGGAAEGIHQAAIDVDADLIIVGTHGRSGLARMLVGSVAEDLVRHAHVPVMVARPKQLGGLRKTDQPDPPRPGEDLTSDERVMTNEHIRFGNRRPSHISGLV